MSEDFVRWHAQHGLNYNIGINGSVVYCFQNSYRKIKVLRGRKFKVLYIKTVRRSIICGDMFNIFHFCINYIFTIIIDRKKFYLSNGICNRSSNIRRYRRNSLATPYLGYCSFKNHVKWISLYYRNYQMSSYGIYCLEMAICGALFVFLTKLIWR